jgi:hypothetical protein
MVLDADRVEPGAIRRLDELDRRVRARGVRHGEDPDAQLMAVH